MKYSFYIFLLLFTTLLSCKSPEARKPIQGTSGTFIQQSVERNKKLYNKEKQLFTIIMNKYPERNYIASQNGFWYFYNQKDTLNNKFAQFGDTIVFSYDIKDINEAVIVSKTDIGNQHYIVDKTHQDLISGIRDGIKLMKEGETVTFLFPSYKAYGYYGYENIIGPNTPITSTITLKSINNKNN